jgi:sec-independent protein translocase protein TatC
MGMNKEVIKAKEKMRRNDENDIKSGPIGDEEIPLMEHLTELRRRLIVVLIPFGILILVVFPFSNISLRFLFTNLFYVDMPIFVYSPMEWISVRLLFSFLCALSVTIPLLLYEIFAFMRPGLYPSERKFFLMVVIPSLCLYGVGAFFAYFFVLPLVFSYLIAYSGEIAKVALSAKRIFSTILYTAVGFGLIFQIPLIMTLAVKMKLVTYSWLKEKRLIIYGLIIGIAFFVIADPTGISMLMAGVSIAMFELGLLITKYIGHRHR